MSENLYNLAHKATNEAYRSGYDGILWNDTVVKWRMRIMDSPLCFTEEVLDDADGFGKDDQ